jgi:hypothetical protein
MQCLASATASGPGFASSGAVPQVGPCKSSMPADPCTFTMFESKAELDEFRKRNCSPSQVTARVNQQTCNKAEINPVTGHALCIEPLGAPVEPPPNADLAPCKPDPPTGSWTYGPNCKPQPAGRRLVNVRFAPKADIRQRIEHVCFVPQADIKPLAAHANPSRSFKPSELT